MCDLGPTSFLDSIAPVSMAFKSIGRPYQAHPIYPSRVTHPIYGLDLYISWIARVPYSTTSRSVETSPPIIAPLPDPSGVINLYGFSDPLL